MKVLKIYLQMYATCLQEALRGAAQNAWTLLLPLALVLVQALGANLFFRMGLVGGILFGLLRAALFSGYLYFVREVVSGSKVKLSEFKTSIGAYFWSVINLFFVIWIAELLLQLALGPQAGQVIAALEIVAVLALNAAPEVIAFRGTHGGLDTIRSSFRFLQQNLLEWLIPNALLGGGLWLLWQRAPGEWLLFFAPVFAALFHLFFLFRGHLFTQLDGSSHRQRMFKNRYG